MPDHAAAVLSPERPIDRVLRLMAALREPRTGCPWDLEQDFASLAPYAIEEAHEVAEAAERGDLDGLRDELGDLLLQVVFHAQLGREQGAFDFDAVANGLADKLVRRHPHVFGAEDAKDAEAVGAIWAEAKRREAEQRGDEPARALDGVPVGMPALARAEKLSRKAARVGFDWPDAAQVLAKIREEVDEVEGALASAPETLAEEIGDLLFATANLARHAGLDAEAALRRANAKFQRRFEAMEDAVTAQGRAMKDTPLEALEAAWSAVTRREREAPHAPEARDGGTNASERTV